MHTHRTITIYSLFIVIATQLITSCGSDSNDAGSHTGSQTQAVMSRDEAVTQWCNKSRDCQVEQASACSSQITGIYAQIDAGCFEKDPATRAFDAFLKCMVAQSCDTFADSLTTGPEGATCTAEYAVIQNLTRLQPGGGVQCGTTDTPAE